MPKVIVLRDDNVLFPIRDRRCALCGARKSAFRIECVVCRS